MQSVKKIRNDEKRRQIIAKWMASFAVTAAVVVAVIVVNQIVVHYEDEKGRDEINHN